jgi:hypothetical protein
LFSRKPRNISDLSINRRCRIIFRAILPLLVLASLGSCIKEKFDADLVDPTLQINPGVAAPIGWARYRLDEILVDSLNPDEMVIGPDGFISMVYHSDVYSLQASDIISIGDVDFQMPVENPFKEAYDLDTLPELGVTSRDTIPIPLTFNGTNGASIDSILILSGWIKFSVSSRYPDMSFIANLMEDTVSENQFALTETHLVDSLDLAGKMLPVNPETNSIPMQWTLTMRKSPEVIDPGPILDLNINIVGMKFDVIYGYLGQFSISAGPQSFPVDFFDRTVGGTFYFEDPGLSIRSRNSFGLPIRVDTLSFTALGREGQRTGITGIGLPGPSNPWLLDYPERGQEGQSAEDSLVLNNDNTDLFDVLGTSPGEISVRMAGSTNPEGEDHRNFLLDTSRLSLSTELTLPLYGYADLLLIADTLDFVFGDFYDNPPQEIKRLFFRLDFHSQFPVEVTTQLYFLDQGYNMLDSLFHDAGDNRQIVPGAPVDANGFAVPFHPDPVEIELNREQIDNISSCCYILATGRVTTTGYDPPDITDVRFYSFYFFDTYISAIAELELNSNDY